jgi:carboxyl-terminal processing protease
MKKSAPIWLTIAIAVIAFAAGLLIDRHYLADKSSGDGDGKVNAILDLIAQEYVDTVNLDNLVENSISEILSNLDPHTSYFEALSPKTITEHLDGAIPDVGIAFIIFNDTIYVESTLPGGPADVAGVMPGDRILTIDGQPATHGKATTTGGIIKHLSGPNGSKLTLEVLRQGNAKPLEFTITRNRIIENSIDSCYMLDKTTGYVKVKQFAHDTNREFVRALKQLKQQGAQRYMIDLQGNGGGFMEIAVLMANEFLSLGQPIVSTQGRQRKYDHQYKSDGKGEFQDAELAVLIDEFSASASEIFAGALQDNDRALIVGRRSFGKGLVHQDFTLPDSSVIRLAVARYYTPSGRCIQKDYKHSSPNSYNDEVLQRYKHGEPFNVDSIEIDKSQAFTTRHGRTVYGGGGIIPDIFVPYDLSGITNYYVEVENAGLLQRFAFTYCEKNRTSLNQMTDYKQFLRTTPIDNSIIKEFADFAAENGIAPRWYYINKSRDMILTRLKALIARDIFGPQAYYSILNRNDQTVQTALKALNRHKAAFPIVTTNY